jgi:hypothetical protein
MVEELHHINHYVLVRLLARLKRFKDIFPPTLDTSHTIIINPH